MDTETRVRYHLLDGIRGIVLISMIVYHCSWNLVYIYGVKWPWYHGTGAYVWQQSICWTFILLSGFCWSMGRQHIKRGLLVFGGGLLVTAVTIAVMPQNRVVFGVLTCIGSCMLLMIPLEKLFRKLPAEAGLAAGIALFALTRNINRGFLGFESWNLVALPSNLYRNLLTAYIGVPQGAFFSTDYFSLIPWFFLFMTGYFLYRIFRKTSWLDGAIFGKRIPFFDWLGKHSLLVYLLHQPILYVVLELLNGLGII